MTSSPVRESVVVHGHRRAYVRAGSGPALLLLHGIGNNCQTWNGVIDRLAETHTVIAPDLLGHGDSDKPRGDYSIAAYANGMRDLLSVLDIEQATVVGHSLGGGIALQFAYQFPERCERLALVGSGGLGPELSAGLRAATLPGAELVLTALTGVSGPLRAGLPGRWNGSGSSTGLGRLRDLAEAGDALLALKDVEARRAFLRTLRGVADARGQAVTALDRLYLADADPDAGHLGQPRPDRPGAARRRPCTRWCRPPASRSSPAPVTGRTSTSPTGSATSCWTSWRRTEPAQHDLDSWRQLLSQDSCGRRPRREVATRSGARGALGRRRRGRRAGGRRLRRGRPAGRPASRVLVLDRAAVPARQGLRRRHRTRGARRPRRARHRPRRPDRRATPTCPGCGCAPPAGRRSSGRCTGPRPSSPGPSSTTGC